jgi:lipopolysaccharide biosynthesis regulator YciM
MLLIHELAHALLNHKNYRRDIELIEMETAAWHEAKQYGEKYNVEIKEDVIQDHLDTYRDWLHARSSCPNCLATGYQTKHLTYECPACTHSWKVNEARLCALRRYGIKQK